MDTDGIVSISPSRENIGVYQFTATVKDDGGHKDQASFSVKVCPASWWRSLFQRNADLRISILNIRVRAKRRWTFGRWTHLTFWLGILSLVVPIVGGIWIIFYAFSTPGHHWNYLAVGMLTAFAAFLIGVLTGFLFRYSESSFVGPGSAEATIRICPEFQPC